MSIMMKLGDYSFSLNTAAYQQLRRAIDYRWQSQSRLHNDPAMQYVGRGKEQIELQGTIYPHFRGGFDQIEQMKQEADKAKPLLLVDGQGNIWDSWVIIGINETQEVFAKAGTPKRIVFQLTLLRYGGD